MFGRNRKLKKEYDERLLNLLLEAKSEWEQAREIEKYLNDHDEEVLVRRKIAESKYFHLFKEAKERNLRVARE
ncbi:YaaL family protein [Sporosarcina oncorhynchi]|uniref:YaaL family protein n=1 Tax=Sporosarcina oncorhynchi TaxID=3056444 RepID=A0ABZ0L6N8_9BACL|nr:YaaL family protein [Sporosarcina sp. T2O-4]WOV87598.1 YaaL family protein [Sporosarcina sp. T2O-4]